MASGNSVNILLYGKIGNGKTATRKSFPRQKDTEDKVIRKGEQELVVRLSDFNGRQIRVVDGLSVDTKLDENEVQELHKAAAIAMEYGPFHAIANTMKYGTRLTHADKDILQFLKLTFGKDVVSKHGVVVLTNGDVFEGDQDEGEKQGKGRITFVQWCSQQTGFFREIAEECKNRIVLFNNREKNEGKRAQQLATLLGHIDDRWGDVYTKTDFEKAKESRKLQLLETQEPQIREQVKQKVAEVKDRLRDISRLEARNRAAALDTLLSEVEQLNTSLVKKYTDIQDPELQSQGKQVMRGCTQQVDMLESDVRGKLELTQSSRSSNQQGDRTRLIESQNRWTWCKQRKFILFLLFLVLVVILIIVLVLTLKK